MACCVHGTNAGLGAAPPGPAPPPRRPPKPPPNPPNSITMGTGPVALAGTVKLAWMFTEICGYALLSTCPTKVLVTVGMPPLLPSVVAVTSQFTLGVFDGILP